jgi:hypothetical protein
MRPVLCLAALLLAATSCAAPQASASTAPGGSDYVSCAWPQPPAHQAMARHGKVEPQGAADTGQAPAK